MAICTQGPKKKWHEVIEAAIKELEKENLDDCKDRLEMAKKLGRLIVITIRSVNGWQQWMNFETMDTWTKEEFLDIYPKYKKALINFLKIDAEITKKKQAEYEAKKAEVMEKAKKEAEKAKKTTKNKKKTVYIQ